MNTKIQRFPKIIIFSELVICSSLNKGLRVTLIPSKNESSSPYVVPCHVGHFFPFHKVTESDIPYLIHCKHDPFLLVLLVILVRYKDIILELCLQWFFAISWNFNLQLSVFLSYNKYLIIVGFFVHLYYLPFN
jgi:hypothetical protein